QAVIRPTAQIVANVKKVYPDIPVIGFAKGASLRLARYARETGIDAVAVDAQTPRGWAKDTFGHTHCLQGNIDNILLSSDKQKVIDDTHALLEMWDDVPFIANLGHGIVPHTPIDNVAAISEVIKHYRRARSV
ncbi:MAG: uroporphyrinogen decarboxylase family protein, partial [Leptolyngbyaceae bacterium]|nr:uroporphyrinogen decarboxylase family protein [Leptolyngbyaceae bacterium]